MSMAGAQTGQRKQAAFALPLLHKILASEKVPMDAASIQVVLC